MMFCKTCRIKLTQSNLYTSDHRYCSICSAKHISYLHERRFTLESLREMNIESRIVASD